MSTTPQTNARFAPQTAESAPEGSRETLNQVQKAFGFIPNLLGTLANSPATLHAYTGLDQALNRTSFTPTERQLIALAASVENECSYCGAAHATILKGQLKVDAATVDAIREGESLPDVKRDALVRFVREVVRERGRVSAATTEAFLAAGYQEAQILEVLVGVSLKTISNYLDHISPVTVDSVFAPEVR